VNYVFIEDVKHQEICILKEVVLKESKTLSQSFDPTIVALFFELINESLCQSPQCFVQLVT